MKRTISYLFCQQKGFDYILQKQPFILAQIKYFSVGFLGEKKKEYGINTRAQGSGSGSGVSRGGGECFYT